MNYKIRKADIVDNKIILDFIKEQAAYERMSSEAVVTIEGINSTIFSKDSKIEVLLLEVDDLPVGFALFFPNYSTFLCKYGMYIEEIYIKEEYRGHGYGKALFKHICVVAKERDCGRVEWVCLDWNKPAIDFYLKLGAEPMSGWTTYRLNREQIERMAE